MNNHIRTSTLITFVRTYIHISGSLLLTDLPESENVGIKTDSQNFGQRDEWKDRRSTVSESDDTLQLGVSPRRLDDSTLTP